MDGMWHFRYGVKALRGNGIRMYDMGGHKMVIPQFYYTLILEISDLLYFVYLIVSLGFLL